MIAVATQPEIPEVAASIQGFVELLWQPGDVREVRIPKHNQYGSTAAGYFDNPKSLARAAASWDGKANLYITLNPVNTALLARAANRIAAKAETTTSDADVIRRRWLFIDIDPNRPALISSTDDECQAARTVLDEVASFLDSKGWPEPITAMSGNGWYLLYPIDLPNHPRSLELVKGVLEALASRFNTDAVSIDTTVCNAARLVGLVGSKKVKGDSLTERPHRYSQLDLVPDDFAVVGHELLADIAAGQPKPKATPQKTDSKHTEPKRSLEDMLRDHGIEYRVQPPDAKGITWYHMEQCPFHDDECHPFECGVGQRLPDGSFAGKYFHADGDPRGWQEWKVALGITQHSNGTKPSGDRTSAGGQSIGFKKSAATLLVEIGQECELWHTPSREPYATIKVDGHLENWRLTDKAFKRHLAHQYYLRVAKAPGGQAINDALQVLGGNAIFQGKEYPVYQRIGDLGGRVYLDLCDDVWQAIEITATGWNPVAMAPIKFRRPDGMLPLAMPVKGGRFREALEPVLNLASDDDWSLLQGWEVGTLNPQGPYPVLVLFGEQGSGKSTVARICRRVIDPNTADLRGDIRNTHDLMISAVNGRIIALDNVSHLQPWLSDALCCLSTDAGFGTRELFSDDEEVLFSAMRPVILNGIAEPATRSDLVDRSIMLECVALANPLPERELMAKVDRAAPMALGALLDLASGALARIGQTKIDDAPRMADFAQWVVASDPGGGFLEAYRQNRREASKVVITSSWLATWLAEQSQYEQGPMTPSLLYERLCTTSSFRHDWRTTKEWPGNAKSMSDKIRRLAPNLRAAGVEVIFDRDHAGRTIELKPVTQA